MLNRDTRWSEERTALLIRLSNQGTKPYEIAAHLGISTDAVRSKKRYMRLAPTTNVTWTEEKIEQLKELTAQNLSGGQIGERLGVSRNAVIGKQHRLGLKSGYIQERAPPKRKIRRKQPTFLAPDSSVEPVRIRFMDFNPAVHCREVIEERGEDGLAIYCGRPQFDDLSYCYGHCCKNYLNFVCS